MFKKLSRRSFIQTLSGAGIAFSIQHGFAQDSRANFVLILSDDHGIDEAGCYGNTVIKTPNVDTLAQQGMLFRNAFTTTAMCTPSRSSLYTGLYPRRNGAHQNHSAAREGVQSLPHYLEPLGYRVMLAGKRHIKPEQVFPFEYIRFEDVASFLQNPGKQPFCLVIALSEPHAPYVQFPAGEGYSPEEMIIPPNLVDTPVTRRTMADYWNTVDVMDQQVGRILNLLHERKLEDNTVCIYASDNGSGFPFCKWTLYETGLHLPFIVRFPGTVRSGFKTDAMISYIDLLPTLIHLAGGEAPQDIDGHSFFDVLTGRESDHRSLIFATHTNRGIKQGSEYPIRSIRNHRYKYICNLLSDKTFTNVITEGNPDRSGENAYWLSWIDRAQQDPFAAKRVHDYQHRPAEELYDLENDPYELKNLAMDSATDSIKQDLRHKLQAWMEQQQDDQLDLLP